MKTRHIHGITFSTLAAALLAAFLPGAVGAQVLAPDAGQVLRDLQQTPLAPPPPTRPLRAIGEDAEANEGDSSAKVMVRSVSITGNQEIPLADLQPLVAGLSGAERSLGQLNAAARSITAWYRSRGFAVARAYLPTQDVTDGRINIAVIEGRFSEQKINNRSRLSDERVGAYLGQVKNGDVIRSDQIDRGLLLLQDTPGVGASRATLQPGASVGTSELLIEVDPSKPYNGNVVLDNYGSRYTGEYRLGGTFNFASPLKLGDQLTVGALTAGDKLSYGRVAYQLPVGGSGLKLGAAYFGTRYKIGKEFEALDAHGSATSSSAFASYPFVRSQTVNLNGTLSVEQKDLKQYINATFTPRKVNLGSAGLSGNLQDDWGGGGISRFDLSLVAGKLSIDSAAALAIDAAGARTNGRYNNLTYNLSRLQRLTGSAMLSAVLSGQQAGKNLDSSEKFSLGGQSGVRAYPQGEASGDEGQRLSVDLLYSLMANLQATLFYDWGKVTINKNPYGPPAANSRSLSGVGIGLNASYGAAQIRTALAWRVDGGVPTSIPASAAKNPVLSVQASVSF